MIKKTVLITGSAGFIGMHLTLKLLKSNFKVVGIDNLNDYYDVNLKIDRLKNCGINKIESIDENYLVNIDQDYVFFKLDLQDETGLEILFHKFKFDVVVNLAAQAGVRYSLENPKSYIESNVNGFFNILNQCKIHQVQNFLFASSSSVYGNLGNDIFSEDDVVDRPVSLYAATKKSNELIAHTYSHLYNIKTIGLRFFTAYGPWGRPDMAYYSFTKNILNGEKIKIFNHGKLKRDFTYIDDIIDGIELIISNLDKTDSNYDIYNIGNNAPIELIDFLNILEKSLDKKAVYEFVEMQSGDVFSTRANTNKLQKLGYNPSVDFITGIQNFTNWYKNYYKNGDNN